jgi:hypothetical protein
MRFLEIVPMMILTAMAALAQDSGQREYREVNVPGKLETALLANPVPFVRHELGSLTPPGTVTFYAVVASDRSSRTAKGLEVQLEGDDPFNGDRHCKDTVYIDADGLNELQQSLTGAVEVQKWQAVHISDYDAAELRIPSSILAANRGPQEGVYYVPVEFGSYWDEGRFGVYVLAPHSRPTSGPHHFTQFLMPNADISEVLSLVKAGRQWLQHYPGGR